MSRFIVLLALVGCAVASLAVADPAESRALELVGKDAVSDEVVRDKLARGHFLNTLRATTSAYAYDQSFNIGGVYAYDVQLLTQTMYKASSWLQVHSEYLNYNAGMKTIHCIQVVDLMKTGKNAAVTVQNGGIGQRTVQMKFKSQRGEKINYLVIIWGQ